MNVFDFVSSISGCTSSVVRDDNGHPYRYDDGGWIPNNEYDLDGCHYETNENGEIISV